MPDLTRDQITQLLNVFGGDAETIVSIEHHNVGPDGPGLYAWITEYPEYGKLLLVKDKTVQRETVVVDASPEIVPPFKEGQDILCLRESEERDYDGRIIGSCKCTKGTVYTSEGCVWHHKFGWLVVITDEMHAAEDFEFVSK